MFSEGVCESLRDTSIHCYDDTLDTFGVGDSMNLQASDYSDDGGGEENNDEITVKFTDGVCYETSTDR